MNRLVLLLCASLAAAQGPAPDVSTLKEQLLGAVDDAARSKVLEQMSRTPPKTAQDISALFDLFSRYPNPELRRVVMASLTLLPPDNPQLEPLFVNYLKQPEAEAQLFGINGAFRLRSRIALPLVRKIAERRFKTADAAQISVLSDRNAWWTQYEALSALAQWQGEKALPLLRKKASESPRVGYLLGRFFWRQTLPDLRSWIDSKDPSVQQKALEAASAKIDSEDARATRDQMLAIVRDPAVDLDLRHKLALKVGACSTDEEVDALIREHDAATDEMTRDLWTAAVSYSRSPRAAPLLARLAQQSSKEEWRAEARAQLVDLVGEQKAKEMLGTVDKQIEK